MSCLDAPENVPDASFHRSRHVVCAQVAPSRRIDILDRILEVLGDTWGAEEERQLCYEFKTFVLAGHETSAAMLTWSLYELTQNSDILAKVCLALSHSTEGHGLHVWGGGGGALFRFPSLQRHLVAQGSRT